MLRLSPLALIASLLLNPSLNAQNKRLAKKKLTDPPSFDLEELNRLKPAAKKKSDQKSQRPGVLPPQIKNGGEDVGVEPNVAALRRILQQMDAVHQRLKASQTDKTTQTLQQLITKELDQLTSTKQANSAAQQPSIADKQGRSNKRKQTGKSKRQANAKGNQAGGPDSTNRSVAQLTESTSEAINKVWGLLPKRLRSRMRSIPDGQYASGYIDLVEDYFRRLSRD